MGECPKASGSPGSAFAGLCRQRSSCRSYRTDLVPRGHVEQILDAARLAPSACNRQPWRFAVVEDESCRHRIVRNGFLPGLNRGWPLVAPLLIVIGMERSVLVHRAAPVLSGVDYPLLDIGIAGEHLVLQATELGLGTCWIGWIKPRAIRRILGWPRGRKPVAVVTLGWPAEKTPPSERKPLDEIAEWL